MSGINIVNTPTLNYNNYTTRQYSPIFRGKYADSFVSNNYKQISLYNPYTMKMCSDRVYINTDREQDIMLESKKSGSIMLHYDPDMTGFVKDKNTGKPVETVILKSENPDNESQFTYHIMSKKLDKEYGYVCLSEKAVEKTDKPSHMPAFLKRFNEYISKGVHLRQDITKDYKKLIEGDRIEIEYCQNLEPDKIRGIGKLADKLAVKYCLENQLTPNVVFYSMNNSHFENYKRGNRFLPLDEGSELAKTFRDKYGTDDVNIVMNKLLKKGGNIKSKTKSWGDLGMYIPSSKVDGYSKNYLHVEDMMIENPFKKGEYYSTDLYIDMERPREFTLKNDNDLELFVKYDPKMKGHLIDKKSGEPIDVYILRVRDDDNPDEDAFLFMSKDLSQKYGYVELDRGYEEYDEDLYEDYKNQKIVGERVVVAYLKNEMKAKVGGVGQLADRVAVMYCKENDIDPHCIISHAAEGSHVAHYLRGKRFIPPSRCSWVYSSLRDHYGDSNPNRVLKRMISESKKKSEPVDIRGWGDLNLIMYLPDDLVNKYSEEGLK